MRQRKGQLLSKAVAGFRLSLPVVRHLQKDEVDAVGHKVSRGLLAQVVAEQHLICVLVQREVQETDDVHGRIVELRIVGLRPRLAKEVPAVFLHCEHLLLYREGGVEQHPLREMNLPFPLHLHHEAAAGRIHAFYIEEGIVPAIEGILLAELAGVVLYVHYVPLWYEFLEQRQKGLLVGRGAEYTHEPLIHQDVDVAADGVFFFHRQ